MSGPRLIKHEQFPSRHLRNRRDLVVYVPPGYDLEPRRRYPLLYLQDGQNLFEGATAFVPGVHWGVGQTADQFIHKGLVEPVIIVGIYNAGKHRLAEYTPTRAPRLGGGSAKRYAKFLLEEMQPFLISQYRVLGGPENTGIGGSSLGALVSLYLGLRMPRIFGKVAALSPSLWWNDRMMLRFVAQTRIRQLPRIWLDVGTKEGARTVDDVERFRDVLLKRGWELGRNLSYQCIEGGEHSEAAWAQRVGPFLRFLFPAPESRV